MTETQTGTVLHRVDQINICIQYNNKKSAYCAPLSLLCLSFSMSHKSQHLVLYRPDGLSCCSANVVTAVKGNVYYACLT